MNFEKLIELSDGDTDFIYETISTILESLPEDLEIFDTRVKENNWKEVSRIAHKIKPTIELLEMTEVQSIVKMIEMNGKNSENLDQLPDMAKYLSGYLKERIIELKDIRDNL